MDETHVDYIDSEHNDVQRPEFHIQSLIVTIVSLIFLFLYIELNVFKILRHW